MASSPLIVDGFRPTHVSSDVRTASDAGKRAQPSQHGDRSASAACDTPKAGVAGRKNSSGQVRNDGRGQVESHLGRNRLTSDAPYKVGSTVGLRLAVDPVEMGLHSGACHPEDVGGVSQGMTVEQLTKHLCFARRKAERG
jgi:hypothetical protein